MLFSATTFLQNLQQELQVTVFQSEIGYGVIAELYQKFCNFFNGCEKLETEHIQLLAHCCLQYIDGIQNYIDNTPGCGTIHIKSIKEFIAVVGDISKLENVKDAYLLYITIPIFEKITEPDIKIWFSKELLRNFNMAVQGTRRRLRHSIVDSHPLHLCRLADLICTCGDYDYQVMLLEAIFRMCSELQISRYAHELFPTSNEFESGFCSINKDHFDRDVRTFLNMVNGKLKKVLSVKCEIVQLGDTKIAAPKYPGGGELPIWADFNLGTEMITILCDKDCLRTTSLSENSDNEDFELITINVLDISNVLVHRCMVPDSPCCVGLLIIFNMTGPCSVLFPSSVEARKASQLKVAIYNSLELTELIESILPNWFGDNLKRFSPVMPNEDSEVNQKRKESARMGISSSSRVYKSLNAVSSDSQTEKRKETLTSSISELASPERQENLKLKHKSRKPARLHILEKKAYKPLISEEGVLQSRPASTLSTKSSISDALSLKGKLLAHQAVHFLTNEKSRVSKSPNIRNVEQLTEMAADPKFMLLAEKQIKHQIPPKNENFVMDPKRSENIDNNNFEQNSRTNTNTKCDVAIMKNKEIIKIKWQWPKKVSVPESFPKMSMAARKVVSNEEQSNDENYQQKENENSCTEKQLQDTLEDKVVPFLPKSLGKDKFTKAKNSVNETNVKITRRPKNSKPQQKKMAVIKRTSSKRQTKSREIKTTSNTESTHTEEPSTVNVLISGDFCSDADPSVYTENAVETSFESPTPFTSHISKFVGDKENEFNRSTLDTEVDIGNLNLKCRDTTEETNFQHTGSSVIDLDDQRQVYNENNEIAVTQLAFSEGNQLEIMGQTVENMSEDLIQHVNSNPESSEDTEKGGSSGIVESSQPTENDQYYKTNLKTVGHKNKFEKQSRIARCNFKIKCSRTPKTVKDNRIRIPVSIDSSVDNSVDSNTLNDHDEISEEEQCGKEILYDENNLKACNITESFRENENEIGKILIKEANGQAETNEAPQLIGDVIDKNLKSVSEGSIADCIDQPSVLEAVFDNLLEEYKASQVSCISNVTRNEEPLNTKPSEIKLNEFTLSNPAANLKQMGYVNKRNNAEKKTQGHCEVLDPVALIKISEYSKIHVAVEETPKETSSEEFFQELKLVKTIKTSSVKKETKKGKKVNELTTEPNLNKSVQKKTPEEDNLRTCNDIKIIPEETSSQEFLENSKLSGKNKILQKKCKSYVVSNDHQRLHKGSLSSEEPSKKGGIMDEKDTSNVFQELKLVKTIKTSSVKKDTKKGKKVNDLTTEPNLNKSVQKKTPEEDNLRSCNDIKIIPEETSSQEFLENSKLSGRNKILQKKCKSYVVSNDHQRLHKGSLSSEEPSKKGDIMDKKDTSNEDCSNIRKIAGDVDEETSSQEFIKNITSIEKQKILHRMQNRKVKAQPKKISQKYVSTKARRRSKRIDNVKEKSRSKTVDPVPQNFNKHVQGIIDVNILLPFEEVGSITETSKTNEVEGPIQIKQQNIDQQNNTASMERNNMETKGEEIVAVAKKIITERSENQLQNIALLNDEKQKASKTTQKNQKQEIIHVSNENDDQVVSTVHNDEKLCVDSFVEEEVLDTEMLNENNILILENAQPRNSSMEQNEDQVPIVSDNSDQYTQQKSPVGRSVENQFLNRELMESSIPVLEIAQLDIPIKIQYEDQSLHASNSGNQQTRHTSIEEQLPDKELKENNVVWESIQLDTCVNKQNEDQAPHALDNGNQQTHESSSASNSIEEQLPANEVEKNDIPNLKTAQAQITNMRTNEDQSLQHETIRNAQLLPVPNKTNDEQLLEQNIKLNYKFINGKQTTLVEATSFDQLLLESNIPPNRKRNISAVNYDGETPKKRIKELLQTNPTEEINKINTTNSTVVEKMEWIKLKPRKLYNLDEALYFNDNEISVTKREKSPKSTNQLVTESPNKKLEAVINVSVEDYSLTSHKIPLRQNSINENRSYVKSQTNLGKLENDNEVKFDLKTVNKNQKSDVKKLTKNNHQNHLENELPKRRSNKRSNKDEKGHYKKQRTSWESAQLIRRDTFESVTYTGVHLNSPNQLERKCQFDSLMRSLDSTLKQYTADINNPKRQKNYRNYGNKRKSNEHKYKTLNLLDKNQKGRSKQIKEKENISHHYKKLLTQLSSPLSELSVEKDTMEVTTIQLSDAEVEREQCVQSYTNSKSSSGAIKNIKNDVCKLEDLNDVNNIPSLPTNQGVSDEYFPVSPLKTPTKSVLTSNDIGGWVEGATIIHEVRKLRRQISKIELAILNIQNLLQENISENNVN